MRYKVEGPGDRSDTGLQGPEGGTSHLFLRWVESLQAGSMPMLWWQGELLVTQQLGLQIYVPLTWFSRRAQLKDTHTLPGEG